VTWGGSASPKILRISCQEEGLCRLYSGGATQVYLFEPWLLQTEVLQQSEVLQTRKKRANRLTNLAYIDDMLITWQYYCYTILCS
jgi:hypothetical protein